MTRKTERDPELKARLGVEGDAVTIITPGAGGYGPSGERDGTLVARDLREKKISTEVARGVCGVDLPAAGAQG
ncbi:MAG: hypothetical protein HY727_10490 [Candidatus Rokubacteria bacterium]|nr:hypothetical protein [Candidatus Rokubacteria bacterium]